MSEGEVKNVSQAQQTESAPSKTGEPTKSAAPGYSTDTTVSNMAELREKAGEVYDAMMKGLAQSIITKMRRQQERLKKMWRDGRNNR